MFLLFFGLVFLCFCVVFCVFLVLLFFGGQTLKHQFWLKNGQSRSGQRRSPKFWPQSSIKIGQSRSNFLAKVGFAKVGLAKVGQIRMAKVGLAKVAHSQPNTLWLEVNDIRSWSTEDGSCALGICDCCNEIGRDSWCTWWDFGLTPWMATRTIRIPCFLPMEWTPGAGTMGLAKLHTTSCGDCCASACHLTPGHWEPGGGELPCDCLQLVPPR